MRSARRRLAGVQKPLLRRNKAQQTRRGCVVFTAGLPMHTPSPASLCLTSTKPQHAASLHNYRVAYNYHNHCRTTSFPTKCSQGFDKLSHPGPPLVFFLVFVWERPAAPRRPLYKHKESGPSRCRHNTTSSPTKPAAPRNACRGATSDRQPLPPLNAACPQSDSSVYPPPPGVTWVRLTLGPPRLPSAGSRQLTSSSH